jgi:RIO kinase 1
LREYREFEPTRRRRRRFDDDDPRPIPTRHSFDLTALDERGGKDITEDDGPPEGDRWTTWDGAEHGPGPDPAG